MISGSPSTETSHFKGKEAIAHVAEAQAAGLIAAAEIHGIEAPGSLSAGADGARETALALGIISLLLEKTAPSPSNFLFFLFLCSLSWVLWKGGRGAWLGWSRLERLHRILEQERWEIQHNREQEREELKVLYAAKGFEGKLLEEVLDVLTADDERLLKVMAEEELGLSLESQEHPLKQGLGAALGASFAAALCLSGYFFFSSTGLFFASLSVIGGGAAFSARGEGNRAIPAIVWNIGLALLAFSALYFFLNDFFSRI